MSYITQYTFEIIEGDESPNDAIELMPAFTNINDIIQEGSGKWYDHEDDMKNLSLLFSNHLFKLSGSGEDPTDIWIKYFRNGKTQHCPARIEFDEYNEEKLI